MALAETSAPLRHIAIRPPKRRTSLRLRDLWEYRELLYFFTWRDVKVRYKQSVVGLGWAVLQPLAMMVIFTIFFGRFVKIPSDGIPRPIFYYSALLPWTFFQQSVTLATNSLVSNGPLVSKVYFPRMLLPMSSVSASLVDFAIAFLLLVGLVAYYAIRGIGNLTLDASLLLVPVLVLLVVVTALAAGMWLSALNARYRDVRYAVGFLLQFWMFASPVVYPTSVVPERWRLLYGLNPMTGAIEGLRWSITGRGTPPGPLLAASALVAVAALIGGVRYFRRYEGNVADII